MKKVLVLLVTVLALNLSSAQVTGYDLSEIKLETTDFVYKTDRNLDVNVRIRITFKNDKYDASALINEEELRGMLLYCMLAVKPILKSPSSYTPSLFLITIKPNSKGKHKYTVIHGYEATNSYGGFTAENVTITFKEDKKTETVGSVMLRMQ